MTLQQVFLYSALCGGVLLLVQIVLSLFGKGDAGIALRGEQAGRGTASTAPLLEMLSLQGLTAFFTMLGLMGLALLKESKVSGPVALVGGVLAGAATSYVIARIFRAARSLAASGNLDLNTTVGQLGTVYLRIAPEKPGKVTISVDGQLMTLDATTTTDAFDAGAEVRVARALPDGSLVVSKS